MVWRHLTGPSSSLRLRLLSVDPLRARDSLLIALEQLKLSGQKQGFGSVFVFYGSGSRALVLTGQKNYFQNFNFYKFFYNVEQY